MVVDGLSGPSLDRLNPLSLHISFDQIRQTFRRQLLAAFLLSHFQTYLLFSSMLVGTVAVEAEAGLGMWGPSG